ncbi:hypothetical protein ACN22W_24515 [Burkholderia theae]|uniref:hypothetical protein n=1 Tax=Burkholderia theae TaxID=3143496 RepID=UPI003AFA459D
MSNTASGCENCNQEAEGQHVPDFATRGFEESTQALSSETQAQLQGVEALKLSVCVAASYNQSTNQICFNIPVYGNFCVTSPVHIPVSATIKACAQTCGSLIPHGLKVSIYLNGSSTPILTKVVWGRCP